MKLKTAIAAIICLCLLTACGEAGNTGIEAENWLERANLEASETPEALYEAARAEGTLLIYTNTTRILAVKKTFEAAYPGLVVEVVDLRGSDILRLVAEKHEAGEYLCDLIICTDESGVMSHELIPEGIIHKYVPPDLAVHILPQFNQETLVFLREAQIAFYNREAYAEPPVSNWWELTEPRFRDNIYMENPLKSDTVTAFLLTFIQRSDLMEEAYQDLYGVPLEIPEGSNAGQEFIRLLLQNGLVLTNSNAEVSEAVGLPGQTNPPVGIMISSRIRNNDMGYQLAPLWDMKPFTGASAPNSIMLVDGSPNVNGAKLFIRWLLGESDGRGAGSEPYLSPGTWSVRNDVKSEETADFCSLTLLSDKDFFYDNRDSFSEFWLSVLAAPDSNQTVTP